MKAKRMFALLVAGTMTLGLAACGGGTKPTDKDAAGDDGDKSQNEAGAEEESKDNAEADAGDEGEGDTITIWAWDEAFNIKAANVAKEMYIANHPDANVEVVTMAQDDIVTKLNTSLGSASYEGLPDIVLIEDYRIKGYLNAYPDEFADLSDIASASDFAEYKTGVNQKDGKMYGIPFDSGVAAVFYRTDYIEEAGYTSADMENLTWDKYIEIGKAVQEKTGKYMLTLDPSDLGQIRMMLQSAGSWYTGEDGSVTIADNQALKDALNTYMELVNSGISKQISGWDQFVGAFNSGEVASVPTGCWISPSVLKAEDQSGKWAVTAFPKMAENADSVNSSSIGGAGWYVLKNVGNEAAAKDFLKETFASNVELMNQLAVDINLVSTLTAASAAENYSKGVEFYGGQEIFADFAEWTAQVPTVNYGEDTYAIESLMAEALQAIMSGADMEETLSQYQTQIEAAVAN